MANKIKYHGKIRLNFKKVFSIMKDKTTLMDYTVDSQRKNYYKSRNTKELQFHSKIAKSYKNDIQKFYRYVNVKFKDTLPSNFWQKFKIDRDTARVQVMCHKPGTVSIPHVDKYNSFLIDTTKTSNKEKRKKVKRIWITLTDPMMGHVLFVQNEVAYNLPKGTALEFDNNLIHAGGNIGYEDRYVMTVTGWQHGQ